MSTDVAAAVAMTLLTAGGGTMGYVRKGTVPSLIAGWCFGLLYLAAAWCLAFPTNATHKDPKYATKFLAGRRIANIATAILSSCLAATFSGRAVISGSVTPMVAVVSTLALGSCAYHFTRSRKLKKQS